MTRKIVHAAAGIAAIVLMAGGTAAADGNVEQGAKTFRQCAACHALKPGDHRTGPSLADIWGRKAGTIEGFTRYSEALRDSDVVWNAETLDAWLLDPKTVVPGNRMVFRGIADAGQRRDLIAFLKSVGDKEAAAGQEPRVPAMHDLKALEPNNRVTAIRHCREAYEVTTAEGRTHTFWEFNLRIKVDSGANGPMPGAPVLIPSGMMGDRAFIVFAQPEEISPAIAKGC